MKTEVKRAMIRQQELGFTLIELLIVIVILGILAAVVIPQFSNSTTEAKLSALKSNLATVRGALELYAIQHNNEYPDASTDSATFKKLLTLYTKANHVYSASVDSNYPYGPYIRHTFPKNPFAEDPNAADDIYINTTNKTLGNFDGISGSQGWLYKPATGEFVANDSKYTKY
ncbi:MAG: type II secretion system protein [bacterium]